MLCPNVVSFSTTFSQLKLGTLAFAKTSAKRPVSKESRQPKSRQPKKRRQPKRAVSRKSAVSQRKPPAEKEPKRSTDIMRSVICIKRALKQRQAQQ